MSGERVWKRAQSVRLEVADTIEPVISVCFDRKIPIEMKHELRSFVRYIETNYRIPITLYVDFEYKHYLVSREGKRVGYLFYWSDFVSYPVFQNFDDIPVIRLPVRTERSSVEDILFSFLEAMTDYYEWICNEPVAGAHDLDEKDAEAVLEKYLEARDSGEWNFIG